VSLDARQEDDLASLELRIDNHGSAEARVSLSSVRDAGPVLLRASGSERAVDTDDGPRDALQVQRAGSPLRIGANRGMHVFFPGSDLFGSASPPSGSRARLRAQVTTTSGSFDQDVDVEVTELSRGIRWALGK
jgi:hypothetical protein